MKGVQQGHTHHRCSFLLFSCCTTAYSSPSSDRQLLMTPCRAAAWSRWLAMDVCMSVATPTDGLHTVLSV